MSKNTTEEKKRRFEEGLVNTFRMRMEEYNRFLTTEMAQFGTIEASGMGNFTDPETGKQYGFKLTIGSPDFFEEEEPEVDEEDEDE